MKNFTLDDLNLIRGHIKQLADDNINEIEKWLLSPGLLSLTQPIFFDELFLIMKDINENNIKGDIIEAGVWRGATALYIKALLNYTKSNRNLWLFDLFEKKIDASRLKHSKDINSLKHFQSIGDEIISNYTIVVDTFKKNNLLDSKVKFIKGDIFNTYKNCSTKEIAVLRLDLDFYEPTMFMLEKFYDRVTSGGYIVIDDYWVKHFNCKDAVDKFREDNNIKNELISVGDFVAYWKK